MAKEDKDSKVKPLSDKEFGEAMAELGKRLEHTAVAKLFTALSCSQEFIGAMCDGQARLGKPVPPKLLELRKLNDAALKYAQPLVSEMKGGRA